MSVGGRVVATARRLAVETVGEANIVDVKNSRHDEPQVYPIGVDDVARVGRGRPRGCKIGHGEREQAKAQPQVRTGSPLNSTSTTRILLHHYSRK